MIEKFTRSVKKGSFRGVSHLLLSMIVAFNESI